MLERSRDAAFASMVTDQRGLLLAVAHLLHGTRSRAENVVQSALAQLYAQGHPTATDPKAALQRVLYAQPARLVLPWQRGERFELIDATASTARPARVVTDLADLDGAARRVIVLERYAQRSHAEIASLLALDQAHVGALAVDAQARLAEHDPRRAGTGHLAGELRAAVPPELTLPRADPGDDIAHGRFLQRRRRQRRAGGAVALIIVLVLGVTQLVRASPPDAGTDLSAPALPASPRATCDTSEPSCQSDLVSDWRRQMARVSASYVDPKGTYFSGYSFSFDDLYDSQDFWRGQGGALGFRLSGQRRGATEVYVQVATSAKYALPCGQLTHQSCAPLRFMDGNVFTLTPTTFARQGLEAQYSPRGDEVITVVARNTSTGAALEITRAQLVSLVQDPRLRLPPV